MTSLLSAGSCSHAIIRPFSICRALGGGGGGGVTRNHQVGISLISDIGTPLNSRLSFGGLKQVGRPEDNSSIKTFS